MRTEQRIGRPYDIPASIARTCHGATLQVGDASIVVDGESTEAVVAEKAGGANANLVFSLDLEPLMFEDLHASGCPAECVELVVLETLPLIRATSVAWRSPLSELNPGRLNLDLLALVTPRYLEAASNGGRAWLTAYLVSLEEGKAAAFPFGIWLSRAKFAFGGGGRGFQYAIHPLDELQYEAGVPRKAASYLEVVGNVATSNVEDLDVTIFVNKGLLDQLRAIDSPSSTLSKNRIELDVIFGLLVRLGSDCKAQGIDSWIGLAQYENSCGTRLIKNLGQVVGSKGSDGAEWAFGLLMGGGLSVLRAALEAELGMLDLETAALRPNSKAGG